MKHTKLHGSYQLPFIFVLLIVVFAIWWLFLCIKMEEITPNSPETLVSTNNNSSETLVFSPQEEYPDVVKEFLPSINPPLEEAHPTQPTVELVTVVVEAEVGTSGASSAALPSPRTVHTNSSDVEEECGDASAVAESGNEAALGCNAETLSYSHAVLFTELPDLVIEEILKRLDIATLLSLRLTCHVSKRWVDALPNFISHFSLVISSNEEMTNVCSHWKRFPTTPKWKIISFPEKSFTSYPSFPSFVSIFSSHLTTLHLKHFNGGLAEILFLSSCEMLEYLKIDEMDLRQNPTLVIASDKMLKAKCPTLLDIFVEMKGFTVGIIYFNEVKQLGFYQTFLQRCKKLQLINVPRPQGPPSISWENLKQVQLKWLIGPISEYLHKKPMTKPIKSDIEILDVDGLFSRHFPVVAEACVQIGSSTRFLNVNEKHVKYLFTHEGNILQRIVSLREKIDDRRSIDKWDSLERLYVRSSRCDVRNVYPEQGFTSYPSLKSLTIVMDSKSKEDPQFGMLYRLIQLLVVGRERNNLREFVLVWPQFSHDTPQDYVRAKDFVGGFANLTKLHVNGWTVPDDDFLLVLETLGHLKTLILEECLNLTDWGLLGPENLPRPAITNLTRLRRLEIRNRNCKGYITDECFERAFRHMRLQYFLLESFQATVHGYQSLTTGQFRETIGKLPRPHTLPRGMVTEEDFTLFVVSNFPNVLL